MRNVDFNQAPFLVIWETTQACALACRHCRAAARPWRDPSELTTDEGLRLIRETAAMGTPLIIFSGGDPVNRPDLFRLIQFGKEEGLRTATIPAATHALTRDVVWKFKEAGLDQMALSLDFPHPELHDTFRGVPGAFAKTVEAASWARELGLPLQINTTVCADTAPFLQEMAAFVAGLGIVFWEVFFLVPIGRGTRLRSLSAQQCERLFAILYRVQQNAHFIVKLTEAPHYRRYVAQHEPRVFGSKFDASVPNGHGRKSDVQAPAGLTVSEGPGHSLGLAPRGVNAGNGFLFVSHTGEIYPSGFLPLSVGNLRERSLADAYRNSELFRQLRSRELFKGACARCEYRSICGGSRSRAFALTGDPFASDPWCIYKPPVCTAADQ